MGFWEFYYGFVIWCLLIVIVIVFFFVLILFIYFLFEFFCWFVLKNWSDLVCEVILVFRGLLVEFMEVEVEFVGIEYFFEEIGKGSIKISDMFKMGEEKLFY